MALTSSSTYSDAVAQFQDNSDYAIDGSAAKALLVVEAIDHIILLQPRQVGRGAVNQQYSHEFLHEARQRATRYAARMSSATNSGRVHYGFKHART